MPSTFGSFVVHKDEKGVHISHNPPKNIGENEAKRTLYAGPRVIMPETVLVRRRLKDTSERRLKGYQLD